MHELPPIPVRRKSKGLARLDGTALALLRPIHATQVTHICVRQGVRVAQSRQPDAAARTWQYLTRVRVCQVRNNTYFAWGHRLDLILRAPAWCTPHDAQAPPPIAVAPTVGFGLPDRRNPASRRFVARRYPLARTEICRALRTRELHVLLNDPGTIRLKRSETISLPRDP